MNPGGRRPGVRAGRRGQTTIDYSVGVGVFLLAVAFIFLFLPSVFAPFTAEGGDRLVLADRSADQLAADLLVETETNPTALNATCTVEFFDADGDVGACRYDEDGSDPAAALGISQVGVDLNVTVRRTGGGIRTVDGTRLAAGDEPGPGDDVAVARRAVLLDGRQSRLVVRVW